LVKLLGDQRLHQRAGLRRAPLAKVVRDHDLRKYIL
jgi:hypothetical protein